MRFMGLVTAIATIGALPPSSRQAAVVPGPAWGQAIGGLRIGIATVNDRTIPSADTQFDVALENNGAADFVLNLGYMLANGKVMFPSAIRLVLTDPSGRRGSWNTLIANTRASPGAWTTSRSACE